MQREHNPKNLKTVPAGNQNSLIKKSFCPKQGKSLKNYAIFRFSCKPRGTISPAIKHVFEKSVAKVLQKQLPEKCQVPKSLILLGFQPHLNQKKLLPLVYDEWFCILLTNICSFANMFIKNLLGRIIWIKSLKYLI